jgi:hypothetical protein
MFWCFKGWTYGCESQRPESVNRRVAVNYEFSLHRNLGVSKIRAIGMSWGCYKTAIRLDYE